MILLQFQIDACSVFVASSYNATVPVLYMVQFALAKFINVQYYFTFVVVMLHNISSQVQLGNPKSSTNLTTCLHSESM